jgi:hypothetical protein
MLINAASKLRRLRCGLGGREELVDTPIGDISWSQSRSPNQEPALVELEHVPLELGGGSPTPVGLGRLLSRRNGRGFTPICSAVSFTISGPISARVPVEVLGRDGVPAGAPRPLQEVAVLVEHERPGELRRRVGRCSRLVPCHPGRLFQFSRAPGFPGVNVPPSTSALTSGLNRSRPEPYSVDVRSFVGFLSRGYLVYAGRGLRCCV